MRVQPIGHATNSAAIQSARAIPNKSTALQVDASVPITESSKAESIDLIPIVTSDKAPQSPRDTDSVSDDGKSGRAHGVLRLLQEGHFNGVADVRLRINFFDELSAEANESARQTVGAEADKLADTVIASAEGLLGPLATDQESQAALSELIAAFDSNIRQSAADASEQTIFEAAALTESMSATFDSFLAQASSLLTPATIEPVEDSQTQAPTTARDGSGSFDLKLVTSTETPALTEPSSGSELSLVTGVEQPVSTAPITADPASPQEVVEQQSPDLADATALLRDAFTEALASFASTLKQSTTLSDPVASSSNGGAFEKFLTIYNDLRGISTDVDHVA
jgi:hypothetical protein